MYQCLKVSKFSKDDRIYYLTKFLDTNRAEVFSVYSRHCPSFDVGTTYELRLQPNFKGFNFLVDDE